MNIHGDMSAQLSITSGSYSSRGIKEENQDFHGLVAPDEPLLTTKGIAAVVCDGMSASYAGREASETCGKGFLADYLSTPESWTVQKSAQKIIGALNSWLYSKGHQNAQERYGLVTTFSAAVFKSNTAHIFHVGDSRIYRLREDGLEQLTRDHRVWISPEKNYLNRAIGIDIHLDMDYRKAPLQVGDIYLFSTDGVHDYLSDAEILRIIRQNQEDLERAARLLVVTALETGNSQDNLTAQLIRIETLPLQEADELYHQLTELPFPPDLQSGNIIDGYKIIREVHASKRSQCYLAIDTENNEQVLIKTPSVNFEDDPDYIESFLMEEWVGRRINNHHVLKTYEKTRKRSFLYHVTEYLEGQTLREWMHDHPEPGLAEVRAIVEQIARGLLAFHRMEMVHRDLKPENIMIDRHGVVKIIDFGSTKIGGLEEIFTPLEHDNLVGTVDYTAPEFIQGEPGDTRSDLYSLAVITYEMLSGHLPYTNPSNMRTIRRREYIPIRQYRPDIPEWVNGALKKAMMADPDKRYQEISEFLYDLSHPNPAFASTRSRPLIERNPVKFWRTAAIIMLLANFVLLTLLLR